MELYNYKKTHLDIQYLVAVSSTCSVVFPVYMTNSENQVFVGIPPKSSCTCAVHECCRCCKIELPSTAS